MLRDARNAITEAIFRAKLEQYKKRGLRIADDCRIISMPSFGSEPYLISIGRHVTISGRVSFITHDGATWVFRHLPGYERIVKYGRIDILDNCFIGYGAIMLPGVTIGPNAVVAAGSVIVKDVLPNTVVGGNPGREIARVDELAEKSLALTPAYDEAAYRRDKRAELLRVLPPPVGTTGPDL